jgi:DNA-binding protein WhiA
MSFSSEVKNELSRTYPEKRCCQLAEIGGFIRASGSIRLAGAGKFYVVLSTENPAIARHYKTLIQNYFSLAPELHVDQQTTFPRGRVYRLLIGPDKRSEQILRETGILMVRRGNNYLTDGIYPNLIKTKCDRRSYLKGIFLGSGSVTDPKKSYHLEILCETRQLAEDIQKMIGKFEDLEAKIAKRREKFIVYMKRSSYIRDTLALMGANSHVLLFDDILIKKETLNEAVRLTNCDDANTDRTLDASEKQIRAILKIRRGGRYESLPPKLRELAELRLAHPDASLAELGELLDPPLKKSGVNSRMQKIIKFSE